MQRSISPPARAPGFSARWESFQRRNAPYIFVAPFFILFLIFGLFPTLFSLYVSLHTWQPAAGLGAMKWNGIENYTFTLSDPTFWLSVRNTVILALESGVPQHLIAIPLAFAIHTGLKRVQSLVTAVFFLPYITSVVAIAIIFSTLFSWQYGILNTLIGWLNTWPVLGAILPDEKINWLGNRQFLQPSIAAVVVWRYVGWNTVLYLSGLQAIPGELYEAASVDGASRWQQFRSITLPLLRPITFLAVTLTIIGNLQLFEEPLILVSDTGGIGQQGLTTTMYLFNTFTKYDEAGTAAAMSWLLFVLIGLLTWGNNRLFGRSGLARGD